jgi:hypothetical protein
VPAPLPSMKEQNLAQHKLRVGELRLLQSSVSSSAMRASRGTLTVATVSGRYTPTSSSDQNQNLVAKLSLCTFAATVIHGCHFFVVYERRTAQRLE